MVEDTSDRRWAAAAAETRSSVAPPTHRPALLSRGIPSSKTIALTFDDGPHPLFTDRLVALLQRERVPATFFVVGKMAERYPDLIRDEARAGDLVENHTFSHVRLTGLPAADVRTEFRACSDVIAAITGRPPQFCRPPGGDTDSKVVAAARSQGLTTVLWTDDPGDYARPGTATIVSRLLSKLSGGGIVLLHDGVEQTMDALPQFIRVARARGFEFVTVDRLTPRR